ncbi:hypothetical protein OUZ56_028136 [Daphnia magna]|uniref:Uncharacterized protein n=1 Tax=Daphnia magna TaxID=35525 RepID=A0ABR0B2Z3_9CRUS|nr:hypothetical protein OUZ56_028136 [Daphnia magna]
MATLLNNGSFFPLVVNWLCCRRSRRDVYARAVSLQLVGHGYSLLVCVTNVVRHSKEFRLQPTETFDK